TSISTPTCAPPPNPTLSLNDLLPMHDNKRLAKFAQVMEPRRVPVSNLFRWRTVSCLSQQHPIVSRGLRQLMEYAWPTSMKELVTRSSSSMGIPPHPTCGATSCLIAKGSDA